MPGPGFGAKFFSTISHYKRFERSIAIERLDRFELFEDFMLRQPSVANAGKCTGKNAALRTPNTILWEESVADART
jgi:hypothetical protein